MTGRDLSAQAVKRMLTRAGVPYDDLLLTEHDMTSRQVDIEWSGPWETYREVVISGGTYALRKAAQDALLDAGLRCAPYPDHDEYSRRCAVT